MYSYKTLTVRVMSGLSQFAIGDRTMSTLSDARKCLEEKEAAIEKAKKYWENIYNTPQWYYALVSHLIGCWFVVGGAVGMWKGESYAFEVFVIGIALLLVVPTVCYLQAWHRWGLINYNELWPPNDASIQAIGPFGVMLARDSVAALGTLLVYAMCNLSIDFHFLLAFSIVSALLEIGFVSLFAFCNKPDIEELEKMKKIAQQSVARVRAENRRRQEAKEARQRRIAAIRAEKPETADEFTARGKRFLDEGLLDEALVNFDAALLIDPDHVEANIWKGKAEADQTAKSK